MSFALWALNPPLTPAYLSPLSLLKLPRPTEGETIRPHIMHPANTHGIIGLASSPASVPSLQQPLGVAGERLQLFKVEVYCADHWKAYNAVLPSEKLVESKAETYTAEQAWSDLRHWFARFKRRGKVVSRCLGRFD